MSAGVLVNAILRSLSAVLTLACLMFISSSHAIASNLDDRLLAIDSGRSPPFTLLAIETLMPMKSKQFDSPSLQVMGVYGLDPLSYDEGSSQGSIPLVAETPQGLLQTLKTMGKGYDHETSDLSASTLVVAQDLGNITPVEQNLLDEKDIPPLDSSRIPAGADQGKTQLWQDLNSLADASGSCGGDPQDCCNKNCCRNEQSCTGDSCAQNSAVLADTECTGDNCTEDLSGCSDDSCQQDDCCDCCCCEEASGSLGSGYFGYGAGGGGGGGFGGGGSGAENQAQAKAKSNTPPPTPVPEPSTYLIMAGAALVVAAIRRKQAQKKNNQ